MRLETEDENIRDISPTAVRLPTKLKEKIREAAKKNNRSMGAEIAARLERSFDQPVGITGYLNASFPHEVTAPEVIVPADAIALIIALAERLKNNN